MSDQNLPFAKKSLGQHWLSDAVSLDAMCEAANVQVGDHVLEIGPGLGTLTEKLLERGAHVTALEFDESLIPSLKAKFSKTSAGTFRVEQGDIRTYDYSNLPAGYKIVANIPYYLTANLLRGLTDAANKPEVAALLVQKEVAERVAAGAGSMSLLTVYAQYYYQVTTGLLVPAHLFVPAPKVDSQILILQKHSTVHFADVDTKLFFRLVKAGFSNRRKTLLNSLSGGLHAPKQTITTVLAAAEIGPNQRPQELSLQNWHNLYTRARLANLFA